MLFELLEGSDTNMHLHSQCHLHVRQIKTLSNCVTDILFRKAYSGFKLVTVKYAQKLAT